MKLKFLIAGIISLLSLNSLSQEFRGVWISTVFNKDWPSKSGLSTEEQKAELIQQLDLHAQNGINAVIFQVRTSSDALYKSSIEPWSQWLSGKQGVAPEPFYDPLEFVIEEAHKRGMELHAWLNPYRAEINRAKKASAPNQVSQIHPEWCIGYGRRTYLDPGIPEVREYILSIVKDIITRYNVDGIHFDDYFYPYKVNGEEFNDERSYKMFGKEFPNKADWRRDNVNQIVKMLHETITAHDTKLKFGISPFGIWRNKREHPLGSETNGMTNYHGLYADVRYWLEQSWVDYVIPQLYWPIGDTVADFSTLVDWWNENAFDRHVYIGIGLFNSGPKAKKTLWRERDQIERQITYLRSKANIRGMCFFTSTSFVENPFNINQKLSSKLFATHATLPMMLWKQPLITQIDTIQIASKTDSLTVATTELEKKDTTVLTPTDFRITRQKNQILFAWDTPKNEPLENVKFKIYRFKKKKINSLDEGELYAETVRTKLLIARKRWVLFRKKYTFVVVAEKKGFSSSMSKIARVRLKKGEEGSITNPSVIVY